MNISVLAGYENGYSCENNSFSLRINSDKPLSQYLGNIIKEVDDIYNIMNGVINKHKYIDFYHTFRLCHNDRNYIVRVSKSRGVLYETSAIISSDVNNLKQKLKDNLNDCCKVLEDYSDSGWNCVHFINITMKDSNVIAKVEKDAR